MAVTVKAQKRHKKGIGPNIYFGITKGIAYTVDFAIGFAMDVP